MAVEGPYQHEATSNATDDVYLLAMVESEGKTVPGIARVRKSDGEIVSAAPVWKKQPLYFVDHSRLRIVFKRDKKELMSIPLE